MPKNASLSRMACIRPISLSSRGKKVVLFFFADVCFPGRTAIERGKEIFDIWCLLSPFSLFRPPPLPWGSFLLSHLASPTLLFSSPDTYSVCEDEGKISRPTRAYTQPLKRRPLLFLHFFKKKRERETLLAR